MSSMPAFNQALSILQAASTQGRDDLPQMTETFLRENTPLATANPEAIFTSAVEHFNQGRLYAAEQACRLLLRTHKGQIKAMHLLATIASRLGSHEDAVDLLIDCLDINPALPFIRYDLANALFRCGKYQLALDQCEGLLTSDPENSNYAHLKAAALVKLGSYQAATLTYETILARSPDESQILLRYGIALRIVGRTKEAISAFRRVIELEPVSGEAYWNLANLKIFEFEPADVAAMILAVESEGLKTDQRLQMLFALGKAKDDAEEFDDAFRYYFRANELAKQVTRYNPADTTALVRESMSAFKATFFDSVQSDCQAADPIFILGLPRSGSTLLEQILSNHSAIDATMELSEVTAMVRSLNNTNRTGKANGYPGVMLDLQPAELTLLGQEYLKRTRPFRGDKPFFIDKTPHNYLYIGLIAAILPNAKIIDARRDPMACGFSIYSQYFARGTNYAYDLSHIGLYYRDYLQLMTHWQSVLPGRILTVQYEDVIANMDGEVRKLLAFCGLEFEPACLEFYKSTRAVATVSSEQVRQPLYNSALEHWTHFASHLAPLKAALNSKEPTSA